MTIETDYDIGALVAHADDGIGVVERIEVDIEGKGAPIIVYHVKFDNGKTETCFEFEIGGVGTR